MLPGEAKEQLPSQPAAPEPVAEPGLLTPLLGNSHCPFFTPVLAKTLHQALLLRLLRKNILFFKVTCAILSRSLLSLQMKEVPTWVSTQKLDMGKAKHILPLV